MRLPGLREIYVAHMLRAFLVVAAMAAGVWAQTATDFSGSWTLDQVEAQALLTPRPAAEADGPPPPPPPPRQIAVKITQTSTAFHIERTLGTEDGLTLQQADYRLDGSETTSQMGPILSRTTAAWNGRELVLTTVHAAAGAVGPMAGQVLGNLQETFTLQDGRLVINSIRSIRGSRSTETFVYTRSH